jgi:factor associated with neutral sphingomyelinase activation
MELSSLYSSTGKPKLKTVLSMGKTTDIKFSEIPKAHRMAITHITPLASRPNTVITISQDGFLKVVDLYDKNCQKSFKICEVCISAIAAIKPDELYALGSWDNNIYLFNIVSGNKSKPVVAHNNSISDLKYLTKRKRLLSSSWDCYIKMWRVVGSNLDNEE